MAELIRRKIKLQPPQVLVLCCKPTESFYVEQEKSDRVPDGDRTRKIVTVPARWVTAVRHKAFAEERDMNAKYFRVNEGTEDEYDALDKIGIREMNGYGFDFVEVIRAPGTPKGALTLEEMFNKSATNKTFEKFCEKTISKSKLGDNRRAISMPEIIQAIYAEKARYAAAVVEYEKELAKEAVKVAK